MVMAAMVVWGSSRAGAVTGGVEEVWEGVVAEGAAEGGVPDEDESLEGFRGWGGEEFSWC